MAADKVKVIHEKDGGLRLANVSHFNIVRTFTCGQCFRWKEEADGSFTGVACGRVLNVSQSGSDIILKNCTKRDYEEIWKRYFDLERDYTIISNELSKDKVLGEAVRYGDGLRILKQEFFECMLSFIISANNNIPRIQGILSRFCEMFGESVCYNGNVYHAFPKPEALRGVTEADLSPLRSGYRAKYLSGAVSCFLSGEIEPEKTLKLSAVEARAELCKIPGVGPKVADCVLLFSLGRLDVFPADVWIKRVMKELYGCPENDAAGLGKSLFGVNAGLAQQYLFYWRRALPSTAEKIGS